MFCQHPGKPSNQSFLCKITALAAKLSMVNRRFYLAFPTYLVTPRGRGNLGNYSSSRIRFFYSNSFKSARQFFSSTIKYEKIVFTSSFFSFSNRLDKISIECCPLTEIAGCKNRTLVCNVWICSLSSSARGVKNIFYSRVRNIVCSLLIKTQACLFDE